MTMNTIPTHALLELLAESSKRHADGHVTILRFTTGWKVLFGTPDVSLDGRKHIEAVPIAASFEEGALDALQRLT